MKLQNAVSTAAAWRLSNTLLDLYLTLDFIEDHIQLYVHTFSVSPRLCAYWTTESIKLDSRLSVYFKAVAFLKLADKLRTLGLNDEFMDVLATLLGHFIRYGKHSNSFVGSLDRTAKLMKVVANKSLSTMSLIEIELSKAYLYRALRCKDSDSNSIYCLVNVYLAVLYYITGQYQTAIDHCTLMMRSQDHSQCSSHVVQWELLPKIDDDIDNVLGLAVFYQHARTAALNQQYHRNMSASLQWNYLHIICMSNICPSYRVAILCRDHQHTNLDSIKFVSMTRKRCLSVMYFCLCH